MRSKHEAVLAVLLLFILLVSVAGCSTTNPPSTANQAPSASESGTSPTTTHDPLLEQYLAAYKNDTYANPVSTVTAWNVSWSNSTTARVQSTVVTDGNVKSARDETFIVFPTTQDATLDFDTINRADYSLTSTDPSSAVTYKNATGHPPTLYRDYVYFEGNPANFTVFRVHELQQQDSLVKIATGRTLGA